MRLSVSLLKASAVAAAVFAAAWIRVPHLASSLGIVVRIFIGYGILIAIFSLIIGLPLARLAERFRLLVWWSSTLLGATVGALLGGMFTYRPPLGPNEVENPFALTFSPSNRSSPGFTDNIPYSQADFVGSVALGAIVGGVLGISFWFFYSRSLRANARGNKS
jgi:hypothetical protein